MPINIQTLPKSKIKIKIEIPAKDIEEKLDQAAKNVSRELKVSGFRPGHMPKSIVIQHVGEMRVWQEAASIIFPKAYANAIVENKIDAIGQPQINFEKIAPHNPLIFTAEVAVLPKFTLPDYKKIKVKQKNIDIKPEEIDKTLERLQKSRSAQVKVDRAAKAGDAVEVDFKTYLDNIPVDRGEGKSHPLIIGEKSFIPGFEEQLIGLKLGEKKEFKLKFPADYHQKNLAGKMTEFKVEIKSVKEVKKPELNDDFAKQLGKFKTLAELKEQITKNLKLEKEEKEKGRVEMELMDKIAAQTQMEIPEILIESEINKMLQEIKGTVQAYGGEFDKYLQSIKKTEADLRKEFQENAIKRVKIALILREIAKIEKIKPDEKELDHEIEHTISHYQHDKKILEKINSPEYRDYAFGLLQNKKVFEHLRKICIS